MSQFSQDQQIAAILASGRPSPMRGLNQPLEDGGGPQPAGANAQATPTPQTQPPSFTAQQPSIAQATSPSVSPIAQAAAPTAAPSARQTLKQSLDAKLAANLYSFQHMGSIGGGGFIAANGNFGNSVTGAII